MHNPAKQILTEPYLKECHVELITSLAGGEAVPAHCCILSACSPFFTERLERERPAQGRKVVLELGGLKIGTLRKLVDFLYTSEMEVSREEAQDVLLAARQLRVSELESLQLEGGKLVRAAQGRRLNRECLQPPPSTPISARVVGPSRRPRTPLPPPQAACTPGTGKPKPLGKEDAQEESKGQNTENLAGPFPTKGKPRICPPTEVESSSPKDQSQEPKENKQVPGPVAAELLPPSPTVDEPLLPRKIRLSRSKLSPDVCPAKSLSTVTGPRSAPTPPSRRLWRQKTSSKEVTEEEQGPGKATLLEGTSSPSLPTKVGGNKKRSPEARAHSSDSAEEGQVGRVKLRKIVNGSCWEVVQESPSRDSQESQPTPGPEGESAEETQGPGMVLMEEEDKPSVEIGLCPLDSPACSGLQETLLPTIQFPEQAVVKTEFPDISDMVEKEAEALLGGDCREPYEFVPSLLGQPCEAEEYRITSAAATSELEEILDFMLCDSDIGPSVDSLESPRAGNSRTPTYPLTEPEKNWVEGEEWCLPDVELWPREFAGLEKDPVKIREEKVSVEPLSPLVASHVSEGEGLAVSTTWTSEPGTTSTQPDGQGEKLLCTQSPVHFHTPYGDLSPPCSSWVDTSYGKPSVTDDTLYPEGDSVVACPEIKEEELEDSEKLGLSPGSLEEEGEIDVVDWTARVGQVPFHGLSVWPDPSSESETEVDILT
ncbi:BTB/POZ domain-containing protein 18 isoform X2 [Dromiciops gliroides]|uniref:BTB/POZ domain-containing protein 18 isoform X2 n=1 Tax=Dromiciops gliroides TaxID=33562 RepID=UPI001CC5D902|nr:BTB/POZ domain-containing protein 18 isoform X2 [Dromiciops gliroides]